jgi:hypothetical protein
MHVILFSASTDHGTYVCPFYVSLVDYIHGARYDSLWQLQCSYCLISTCVCMYLVVLNICRSVVMWSQCTGESTVAQMKNKKQNKKVLCSGLPDFSWYYIPKRENIPNDHKIYQSAIQYTKWPEDWPKGHTKYNHLPFQDAPKIHQIGILGFKISHLATLPLLASTPGGN